MSVRGLKRSERLTYTSGGDTQCGALVEHDGGESESLLRLGRSLDEDDGESSLEMPLDVTMHWIPDSSSVTSRGMDREGKGRTHPSSRVVGDESNVDGSSSGDSDRVPPHGVGLVLEVRGVEHGVVGRDVGGDADDLVLVTVQMEGVVSSVPTFDMSVLLA